LTAALLILALAMLGALIYVLKAHARERQETQQQHESQMRAVLHTARLERDAAQRRLEAAHAESVTAQSELIDRFHIPESKRLALMQEQWNMPEAEEPEIEPAPSPDEFAFDPDDYVAEMMSEMEQR
jgi:hypothetical protein